MELRWLEDFRALARTRHFSRAAEEQNVTQPTFSRRIKMLEEELGVMLVNRNTLPLSLTPAGEEFLSGCEKILSAYRKTRERCRELERAETSRLRFATTQTLYLSFYQAWAESLGLEGDQALSVQLKSTDWVGEDFVRALQQGACDLILCFWHPGGGFLELLDEQQFDYQVLATEQLLPVSAVTAEGAPRYQLPGAPDQPLPYIAYKDKTLIGHAIRDHLRQHQLEPALLTLNENTQAVSVKAMVSEGYGMGWLPARLLKGGRDPGLTCAGDGRWHIPLEIRIYRRRTSSHPQMDPFWERIQNSIEATLVAGDAL